MIYVYLEKGNIGIRNENMRDEEQTVRIRTQCCLSLTIRSPSVKPNVMHCFIFHFFWVQLGKHDNRVHRVVNKFYLYDRTSKDFIVPPKASTNPHHCSHPSSLQHDCVWTKTNHQTRLLNFSVQPKELQNHCFVFVFDKKKKKKEKLCVCDSYAHIQWHVHGPVWGPPSLRVLPASVIRGCLKRNSGNVTALQRKPNRLSFPLFLSSYSSFSLSARLQTMPRFPRRSLSVGNPPPSS